MKESLTDRVLQFLFSAYVEFKFRIAEFRQRWKK